tara:strand:- start:120 stop:335 length:216 start_codon:yes stop_codon:yes gene_type:complete
MFGVIAPIAGAITGGLTDKAPFILFKKLLKLPLLSAVVSNFTCGGCAGAAGVGINPPKGPFAMSNLRKKLL